MRAIALLSGGLDSTLAAKVVLDQGIELEALNFLTVFCNCTNKGETCLASQKAVESLGISLRVFNVSEEYLADREESQARLRKSDESLHRLPDLHDEESEGIYARSGRLLSRYRRGAGGKTDVSAQGRDAPH